MFCSHRIWLKPSMDALIRKHNLQQTLDTFRQWTVTKGNLSRKQLMWSTREQLRKYTEMKRSLKAASSTSEASRRSTEEYSALDDGISVTPDTDDTSCETTSQYEVMDDVLPASVRRGNKAMFHMEHLRYELNRWLSTTQKHRKVSKNNYRHTTNQRSPTTHRKLSTPSRTPIRRRRSPQKMITTRKGMVSHERIPTTGIQHPSSSKI